MSKCLLETTRLTKYFGDRKILDIPELRIYEGDRIGLVGANGSGKTTLLNLLSGVLPPDGGRVLRHCAVSYLEQFGTPKPDASREHLGRFGVANRAGAAVVSGGEAARKKLAEVFENLQPLVFADEPTANLDFQGIRLFCEHMAQVRTFLLISHDRSVLEQLCNRIFEIRDGSVACYDGGFSFYQQERQRREARAWKEYEQYQEEKSRLTRIYQQKKQKALSVGATPKNISPREARLRNFLASRSYDVKQKNMERAAAAVKSRLDHLEAKEKPKELLHTSFDFSLTDPPANKIVLRGEGVVLKFGDRVLLENGSFSLPRGTKTALMGVNGCGKTTLLRYVIAAWEKDDSSCIRLAPKARLGYFRQGLENLDPQKTVLENVMAHAVQPERAVRNMLARLLFREDDVQKPASVLSGGERIKLSFAQLFASPSNLLLLDEPTNYLDMPSIEALQTMLQEYEGTVLLVSHDRSFVNAVANRLLLMHGKRLESFDGTLAQYEAKSQKKESALPDAERAVLELRLTAVISRLSLAPPAEKESLELEYQSLLQQLRNQA